jgi:hypothetical protein
MKDRLVLLRGIDVHGRCALIALHTSAERSP